MRHGASARARCASARPFAATGGSLGAAKIATRWSRDGPSVAIVGGGILGLTAAYRLAQAGTHVARVRARARLGGLVGAFDFAGHRVDRFYHVVLPTDDRVRGLAEELGLGDRFRFRPTGVGFYDDARLFSMSSPRNS